MISYWSSSFAILTVSETEFANGFASDAAMVLEVEHAQKANKINPI